MQKNVVRIFSGLLAIVILSVMIVPASADFGGGTGRSDFFTWTDGFGGGSFGGGSGRDQSKAAYDDYVQDIQTDYGTTQFGSNGFILPVPVTGFLQYFIHAEIIESSVGYSFSCSFVGRSSSSSNANSSQCVSVIPDYTLVAPVTGTYTLMLEGSFNRCEIHRSTALPYVRHFAANSVIDESSYCKAPGTSSRYCAFSVRNYNASGTDISTFSGRLYFFVEPVMYSVNDYTANIGGISSRPTSISGGALGIADVDANGQLTGSYTKIDDHSSIVNETNNTYWNPVTNTTSSISNWSYDYSDRSYKVDYTTTNVSGDTVTNTSIITYGDEYITITEIDNSQGDTITNNYTIYYLIDGSGSENPSCSHEWVETSTTPATCTLPGSKLLTCSKCQQTKTETLPALGHNWQVKQTVTTQYDDTGQLVQQGYTIFECSRCKEQYKSTDGTIPPGGGSGTDPGGDEEGEGFLSWLLGKIGELLGTIGNGILNLLQTALEKIFGGLIDLVNSLFENLAKLVDLFGSVGEAFQVLWTWLPPEIMAILVAGVSIFVFVALIKFFMK